MWSLRKVWTSLNEIFIVPRSYLLRWSERKIPSLHYRPMNKLLVHFQAKAEVLETSITFLMNPGFALICKLTATLVQGSITEAMVLSRFVRILEDLSLLGSGERRRHFLWKDLKWSVKIRAYRQGKDRSAVDRGSPKWYDKNLQELSVENGEDTIAPSEHSNADDILCKKLTHYLCSGNQNWYSSCN